LLTPLLKTRAFCCQRLLAFTCANTAHTLFQLKQA
jgi:hypothetical protein